MTMAMTMGMLGPFFYVWLFTVATGSFILSFFYLFLSYVTIAEPRDPISSGQRKASQG
jgi:hypothetical protein